jgi:hypothetical protein
MFVVGLQPKENNWASAQPARPATATIFIMFVVGLQPKENSWA